MSLWLKEEGLSRSTIGWAGLIFGVYAFNYLWAPIVDRIQIPLLTKKIGHRRGWIVLMQVIILLSLIIWSVINPTENLALLISVGLIWGLYTLNEVLGPSWLGYFLSTTTISIGSIILMDNLFGNNDLLQIIILILGSVLFVWASIQLSEQVIFYIGGLGLVINLPRLITELLPDNIWPPLILFLVGGVLVAVGLYLNSIRENIKK